MRLLRAFASSATETNVEAAPSAGTHVCTTSWCPVCQVVGFVKEHPEVVEQIADSAIQMVRSVRDVLLDQAQPSAGPDQTSTP